MRTSRYRQNSRRKNRACGSACWKGGSKKSSSERIALRRRITTTEKEAVSTLYMHDTIEVFSKTLDELQKLFRREVAPRLHSRRVAELEAAADRLFGTIGDTIREAALMATGRKLSPGRLAETAQAGLKEAFWSRK